MEDILSVVAQYGWGFFLSDKATMLQVSLLCDWKYIKKKRRKRKEEIINIPFNSKKKLHTFDWKKDTKLVKYPYPEDADMLMYKIFHQQIKAR